MVIKVKENSLFAAIAAKCIKSQSVAIVLGKTIHLWKVSKHDFLKNQRWLRHEIVHIRQFEHYGFFHFVVMYVMESINHGYSQNKFEQEARGRENDEYIVQNIKIANP